MRYFVTPDFSNKIKNQPPDITQSLSLLIKRIEQSDKSTLIQNGFDGNPPLLLENDFLVFGIQGQDFRVYTTFGSDSEGEYLLLLDFTVQKKTPTTYSFPTLKDPKTNSIYNPRLNSMINPKLNSMINPRLNSMINPKLNSIINPRLNSMINPKLNSMINPRLNSMINPKLNSVINPRLNSMINPRLNTAYSGPFVYSEGLDKEGYVVKANDNLELIFNLNNDFAALCVKANENVFVLFDDNNEWIGFLVKAVKDVRLRFDLNNDWSGLII